MFMPTKPVTPERIAPSTKPEAETGPEEVEDDRGDDHADEGDRRILAAKVGGGAFLDRSGDLDHALVAGRGAEHLAAGDDPVEHGDEAAGDGNIKRIHWFRLPRLSGEWGRSLKTGGPVEIGGCLGVVGAACNSLG